MQWEGTRGVVPDGLARKHLRPGRREACQDSARLLFGAYVEETFPSEPGGGGPAFHETSPPHDHESILRQALHEKRGPGLCKTERCQARMVSGVTILTTSWSACFPSFWTISASVVRSPSVNRTRPVIWWRRMRFSITRYSLRRSSAYSTVPVIYASRCFQSIAIPLDLCHPSSRRVWVMVRRKASRSGDTGRGVIFSRKARLNILTIRDRIHGHSPRLALQ